MALTTAAASQAATSQAPPECSGLSHCYRGALHSPPGMDNTIREEQEGRCVFHDQQAVVLRCGILQILHWCLSLGMFPSSPSHHKLILL